jgi:hypothetical protein
VAQTNLDLLREKYQIKGGEVFDDPSPTVTKSLTPSEREEENKEYTRSKPFWDAKHELNIMLEFHQLFFSKIKAEELNFQQPQPLLVQITDRAEPPQSPVGFNRVLGAVLLALGLFSLAGGILLLKPMRR